MQGLKLGELIMDLLCSFYREGLYLRTVAHNERRGKECEVPTHLIESQTQPMLHALPKMGITTKYAAKESK